MTFQRFIAIDYSGAGKPDARADGIALWQANAGGSPQRINSVGSRKAVSEHLQGALAEEPRTLVGIDHGFGWTLEAMQHFQLKAWPDLMGHVDAEWGHAREQQVSAAEGRSKLGALAYASKGDDRRRGLRLTEQFSSSAKSVFDFNGPGVALSTLAGLPWLAELRRRSSAHFWPFDGWEVPAARHCVVEIYPSLYRYRYPRVEASADSHDAFATCLWMLDTQHEGFLPSYFKPMLTELQQAQAEVEGWILGIL
jgi:hypothetical protein